MAFIPIPNVVMAEMVYTEDSQYCENVLYFSCSDGIEDSFLDELLGQLHNWWDTQLKPIQCTAVSLVKIKLKDMSQENGIYREQSYITDNSGAVVSDHAPNNVTIAVKFNTARSGRSYRGRNFFIGLSETQLVGNTLTAPTMTALLGAYDDLKDTILPINWEHVVVSRYHNNVARTEGVATRVLSYTIDATVDSQRRRLPGRGR